ILDRLDQLNLTTNTMIVFLGDNGFYLGEHGLGDKRSLYEESLRVPMLIRYPRLITQPVVRDELVLNIDIAHTILDLAGVTVPPEMQGRSWRPLLTSGSVTNWRQSFLAEYFLESGFTIPTTVIVRTPTAKLALWPGNDSWSEMFNLTNDGHEVTNLFNIPAQQSTRNALRTEFDRLMDETGLAARLKNPARTGSNTFQANITGGIGPRYQFEASTNLQTWTPISEIKMNATQTSATDTNATGGAKFHRLNWISD
ncbi:MAG: sulfatase/phosphatase domain-containing protein, partial [Verrucomicrobiota bacterium]